MNKIVIRFLLAGDKCMPKPHLGKTEHCERIKKFKGSGNLNYVYKNSLDKACLPNDAVYFVSKGLAKDKMLKGLLN